MASERRGRRPWEIDVSASAGRSLPGRRILLAVAGLPLLVAVLFVWHLIQARRAMVSDDLPLMTVAASECVEFSAVTNRLTYRRAGDPAGRLSFLVRAGARERLRESAHRSLDLYAILIPYRIEVVGEGTP